MQPYIKPQGSQKQNNTYRINSETMIRLLFDTLIKISQSCIKAKAFKRMEVGIVDQPQSLCGPMFDDVWHETTRRQE